jgi:hypothetical protein
MSQSFGQIQERLYELPTTISKLAREAVNSLGGQLFTNGGESTQLMVVIMGILVLFLLQLIGSLLPSEEDGHKNWQKFRDAIGIVVGYGLTFSAIGTALTLRSVNATNLLAIGGFIWFVGYGLQLAAKDECRVSNAYTPGFVRISGTSGCKKGEIVWADFTAGLLIVGATTAASSILAYLRNAVPKSG